MPGPWNDSSDRQLLLVMLHLAVSKLPDWSVVAQLMGDGFTAESTRQHFQKLRKTAVAEFGDPGAILGEEGRKRGAKAATPNTTPNGSKVGDKTPKSKKRKLAKAEDVEADEECEEPVLKPIKDEYEDDYECV